MTLTVATYNLYFGTSVVPVYGARTVEDMAEALRAGHADMVRTDFPGRAARIAELLAGHQPDVLGLQEVARWDNAGDRCDFLEVLVPLLAANGSRYRVAAVSDNSTLAFHTDGVRISFTDRCALLVREGLSPRDAGRHLFSGRFDVPTRPGIVLTKLRGWCWADVAGIRVANTHLEAYDTTVATAQAEELVTALGRVGDPVVVLGDLNDGPGLDSGAYQCFVKAHYQDAWQLVHGSADGFTGLQTSTLDNPVSRLDQRVDHVLCRGVPVRRAELVGADPGSRLPSGLWPSDHAGLVVECHR